MAIRFRKSIKLGKGMRLNLNKKSVGLSFGTKGARFSMNSKGRKSTTIGVPGTGLSYTHTSGSKKKKARKQTEVRNPYHDNKPLKTGFIPMLLTIFLGWSGIQWFISGRIKKGFAYLFTLGLLLVGWISDIISQIRAVFGGSSKKTAYYIEWQNKLLAEPIPTLVMDKKTLMTQTEGAVESDLSIIHDCMRIIESTTKPDVFFSRLQLLEEKCKHMVLFEQYISFESAKPSDALNEFYEKKQVCISDFIDRYYASVLEKSETLKTEKGKANQFAKFYDSLQPYINYMDERNIDNVKRKGQK